MLVPFEMLFIKAIVNYVQINKMVYQKKTL